MPSVEADIVSDASHGLNYEQPRLVNAALAEFFQG